MTHSGRTAPGLAMFLLAVMLTVGTSGSTAAAAAEPSSPVTERLPAPQWVAATDRGGKVVLSWIRDQRFRFVRIYRSAADEARAFSPIGEARENTFTDETVQPGGSYRYRLVAVGADGTEGRASAELGVRVSATVLKPPGPPVWEGHLVVEKGVSLKWSNQEGADVLVYNVYRRTPPETQFQLVASVRGADFTDTRVEADRPYVYVLTALDSEFRETPFSAELAVVYRPPRGPSDKRTVLEWQPRRTRLVALVTAGDQPLLRPVDVVVGPVSGNVYLSDSGRNRIFVFSSAGVFLRSIGSPPGSATAFRRLRGLSADASETVYAADADQAAVFAHEAGAGAGRAIRLPPFSSQHPPGFVDCAAAPDGRLFVVDNTNNRILIAGASSIPAEIGSTGFGGGQFSAPTFSAVDGQGFLYVADSLNGRVQVFSPTGDFVRAFGRVDQGAPLLGRPKGIAARENGEILVADSWFNAVTVFDPTGQPVGVLVGENGGPLDLGSPNGIALGPGNRIYIAERLASRLQIREIIDEAR